MKSSNFKFKVWFIFALEKEQNYKLKFFSKVLLLTISVSKKHRTMMQLRLCDKKGEATVNGKANVSCHNTGLAVDTIQCITTGVDGC